MDVILTITKYFFLGRKLFCSNELIVLDKKIRLSYKMHNLSKKFRN